MKAKSNAKPTDSEAQTAGEQGLATLADRQALANAPSSALAAVRAVLAQVPAVEDDPTPRMMEAIIHAKSAAEWESLFSAAHFKDSADRRVRVHTFRVSESAFPGGLGVFFICDVTFLDTGEETVLTVGSDMAMAQLLNCWQRGDLPHDFEVVKKDKPTKAGFYPMRFRSINKPVLGDPAVTVEGELAEA